MLPGLCSKTIRRRTNLLPGKMAKYDTELKDLSPSERLKRLRELQEEKRRELEELAKEKETTLKSTEQAIMDSISDMHFEEQRHFEEEKAKEEAKKKADKEEEEPEVVGGEEEEEPESVSEEEDAVVRAEFREYGAPEERSENPADLYELGKVYQGLKHISDGGGGKGIDESAAVQALNTAYDSLKDITDNFSEGEQKDLSEVVSAIQEQVISLSAHAQGIELYNLGQRTETVLNRLAGYISEVDYTP